MFYQEYNYREGERVSYFIVGPGNNTLRGSFHKSFLREMITLTDPRKFSPLKVSRSMVLIAVLVIICCNSGTNHLIHPYMHPKASTS